MGLLDSFYTIQSHMRVQFKSLLSVLLLRNFLSNYTLIHAVMNLI